MASFDITSKRNSQLPSSSAHHLFNDETPVPKLPELLGNEDRPLSDEYLLPLVGDITVATPDLSGSALDAAILLSPTDNSDEDHGTWASDSEMSALFPTDPQTLESMAFETGEHLPRTIRLSESRVLEAPLTLRWHDDPATSATAHSLARFRVSPRTAPALFGSLVGWPAPPTRCGVPCGTETSGGDDEDDDWPRESADRDGDTPDSSLRSCGASSSDDDDDGDGSGKLSTPAQRALPAGAWDFAREVAAYLSAEDIKSVSQMAVAARNEMQGLCYRRVMAHHAQQCCCCYMGPAADVRFMGAPLAALVFPERYAWFRPGLVRAAVVTSHDLGHLRALWAEKSRVWPELGLRGFLAQTFCADLVLKILHRDEPSPPRCECHNSWPVSGEAVGPGEVSGTPAPGHADVAGFAAAVVAALPGTLQLFVASPVELQGSYLGVRDSVLTHLVVDLSESRSGMRTLPALASLRSLEFAPPRGAGYNQCVRHYKGILRIAAAARGRFRRLTVTYAMHCRDPPGTLAKAVKALVYLPGGLDLCKVVFKMEAGRSEAVDEAATWPRGVKAAENGDDSDDDLQVLYVCPSNGDVGSDDEQFDDIGDDRLFQIGRRLYFPQITRLEVQSPRPRDTGVYELALSMERELLFSQHVLGHLELPNLRELAVRGLRPSLTRTSSFWELAGGVCVPMRAVFDLLRPNRELVFGFWLRENSDSGTASPGRCARYPMWHYDPSIVTALRVSLFGTSDMRRMLRALRGFCGLRRLWLESHVGALPMGDDAAHPHARRQRAAVRMASVAMAVHQRPGFRPLLCALEHRAEEDGEEAVCGAYRHALFARPRYLRHLGALMAMRALVAPRFWLEAASACETAAARAGAGRGWFDVDTAADEESDVAAIAATGPGSGGESVHQVQAELCFFELVCRAVRDDSGEGPRQLARLRLGTWAAACLHSPRLAALCLGEDGGTSGALENVEVECLDGASVRLGVRSRARAWEERASREAFLWPFLRRVESSEEDGECDDGGSIDGGGGVVYRVDVEGLRAGWVPGLGGPGKEQDARERDAAHEFIARNNGDDDDSDDAETDKACSSEWWESRFTSARVAHEEDEE